MNSKVNKILVVTLSNLGDVVLTLPVIQSLLSAYSAATLDVVVGPSGAMVFENDKRIRRVILYDKKKSLAEKWGLLCQVRNERYDIIVDLRHSLIGLLGGARARNRYFDFPSKKMQRLRRHLRALKGLAPIRDDESFLKKTALPAHDLNSAGQTVVVAAVGSKSDIKKWPAAYFAHLLDALALERSCRIILVGDKADKADADKVKRAMSSPVEDLTGKTDFTALCSVIRQASLVVTNDSAPLHIADSLRVPVLALFGPTDARKYGPRSSRSLAVSRNIFCSPCEKAQCRFGRECLKELQPDDVYCKALQILNDQIRREGIKILVVRLDRLGDLTLSLPAIDALRRAHPNAQISLMTRSSTRQLLEGHPWVDEVIAYEYEKNGRHRSVLGYFRLLREIIRRRFDVAFILHPGARSHLVPFLAGIPYRVGYRGRWGFLLSTSVPDQRHSGQRHESEYALDLLRAFRVSTPPGLQARLFVPPLLKIKIENELGPIDAEKPDLWIAVHAGSSCPSKRWSLERFEELGKKILRHWPHRLLIVGGKEELAMGQRLKAAWGDRALDMTGKMDLKELPAYLQRCELLISNDSGPVHVAAAVGTRVLSLFGRNQAGLSPRRWRPLGAGHAVIQKDVGCVVCLAHNCPIEFECLKAITVEEVFGQVLGMMTPKEKKIIDLKI